MRFCIAVRTIVAWFSPKIADGESAHRRLNIVDLTGGRQPMLDADRGLTLVFNGEIYEDDRLRKELTRDGFRSRPTRTQKSCLLFMHVITWDFLSI